MTDQQPGATPPPSAPANLPPIVQRVQNILLNPVSEWQAIKAEPATIQGLFVNYAMILAAVPALGILLQNLIHGSVVFGLVWAVIFYVLSLASAYGMGLLIDMLAPSFSAAKDPVQSMKIAVYSMTAYWLGGIAHAVPLVGGLIALLVSLYSLFLLFLGIQALKDAPQDKAIIYTLVSVLIVGVIVAIIGMILSTVLITMLLGSFAFRH